MEPWDLDFRIRHGRIVQVLRNLPYNIGFLENIRFFVFKRKKTEKKEFVLFFKNRIGFQNTVFWTFQDSRLKNFNLFRKNKKKFSFPFSFLNGFEKNSTMPGEKWRKIAQNV